MYFLRCVTILAISIGLVFGASAPASANSKYAALVMHADSGDILFDRYSKSRRYPASLTKMMTLYVLFDEIESGQLTLNSKLSVSKTAAGQPPSKLGVKSGSTISVETAIKALSVKSANDVAVVIAEAISGSEWRFARKMTAKARALGMSRTTFRNASGLPNSKQVTTARDMATLGRRLAQDFPQYFHYFSAKKFTYNGRTYATHNRLLKSFDGVDGIKTGYTRRSGYNLVTTIERDGTRLIGVVLGGRSGATRNRHMRDILGKAYAAIERKPHLIAALHRKKPEPSLKPTLAAAIAAEKASTPTINGNEDLRLEIIAAAEAIGQPIGEDQLGDFMAAGSFTRLPETADSDDFNEFQRTRLAAIGANSSDDPFVGEGDRQRADEFSWSVQIGAYSTKAMAQTELENAAEKSSLADRTRVVLPAHQADGAVLYRARITRLSEIEATLACASLETNGTNCFIVSDPVPSTAQSGTSPTNE